jgi:hypothetical protein
MHETHKQNNRKNHVFSFFFFIGNSETGSTLPEKSGYALLSLCEKQQAISSGFADDNSPPRMKKIDRN